MLLVSYVVRHKKHWRRERTVPGAEKGQSLAQRKRLVIIVVYQHYFPSPM